MTLYHIPETHLSFPVQEDAVALDVPVDDSPGVQVVKGLQACLANSCYLVLMETKTKEQ